MIKKKIKIISILDGGYDVKLTIIQNDDFTFEVIGGKVKDVLITQKEPEVKTSEKEPKETISDKEPQYIQDKEKPEVVKPIKEDKKTKNLSKIHI